ncbi:MAG: C4-type zinc ribbon domain-containing protein [Candidatus Omnitrophica bacterium]|nr:C4-type zinc ribbon domain-containing protein [Candidatus Omnitrophota bacterium]
MNKEGLKEQIRRLIELQNVDSQIFALREEKESKPAEIEALNNAFEEKKKQLTQTEREIQNLLKEKKDKELELTSKEEQIKKLQIQLYQLKTNKEYTAMLKEIEIAKADISLQEDKILEIIDKIDIKQKELQQEKENLAEEEKNFNREKNKIEIRIKEIEERLATLEIKRKDIVADIQPQILMQYERILKNRDGLAIVKVNNNSCEGCNMTLPPQMVNLIKMYERIISCEICQRMLYIEEDIKYD